MGWLDNFESDSDDIGVDPPSSPLPPGSGPGWTPTPAQKRAFYAKFYADVLAQHGGQKPPPPPSGVRSAPKGGSVAQIAQIAQAAQAAQAVPAMVAQASTMASALSSGASTAVTNISNALSGLTDGGDSMGAEFGVEFFDDLSWPGHRYYTHLGPFPKFLPGSLDPFGLAEFGAEMEVSVCDPHDGQIYKGKLSPSGVPCVEDECYDELDPCAFGFDEEFMSASNQLPAFIYG